MGYQALLFCPDEKVARVASQVFSELDFAVEPVAEPFVAVKKLMTQRYDAVVVDCENEQNASLLFKSARNSNSNRSSLAIALVEGQAGVAKAYRMGANLLLTKPINVEQAKGTLRVARGLLRKNSDAAGAPTASAAAPVATAKTAPASAASSSSPASGGAETMAPPPSRPEFADFNVPSPAAIPAAIPEAIPAAFPAMSASAKVEEKPAAAMTPETPSAGPIAYKPAIGARAFVSPRATETGAAQNEAAKISATAEPSPSSSPTFGSALGSGAAPAPAREVAAPPAKEGKPVEAEPAQPSFAAGFHDAAPAPIPSPTLGSARAINAPAFAALKRDDGEGSGARKVLIAVLVVVALAALGYVGYARFGKFWNIGVPRVVNAPQNSAQPASTLTPASNPATSSSTSAPGAASAATQTTAPKTPAMVPLDKPSAVASALAIRPPATAEVPTKKPAPMVVKSGDTGAKSQGQSEDSAPALPTTLADASASNPGLTSLMRTSANIPKPALGTMKISQGVSQGLLIKRVAPRYPQAALAVRAQGTVQIEATVNKEGNVINPKVISGPSILAQAALEAVRQWRYKPYYLNGQPVEIQTQITIEFKPN
jgi:protein TonB